MNANIVSQHENLVKGVLINKNVMLPVSYSGGTNFSGDDIHK